MKILKILGIAAGVHALALLLIFANPGCSSTKAASSDSSPISAAPTPAPGLPNGAISMPDSVGIRYSPTRPGTPVAAALASQPVSDVTPVSTYTVSRGDSLNSIAKKHQLTKADLAAANNLKTSAPLHIGQKLIIPSKAASPAAATTVPPPAAMAEAVPAPAAEKGPMTESTKHVVKAGETLGGIARRYGVRQGEIAVANNITDPKKIQPGQELIIPAHSAAAKPAKGPKATAETAPKAAPPAADQDLDAGLKPASTTDVPVVKIEDAPAPAQPKNP